MGWLSRMPLMVVMRLKLTWINPAHPILPAQALYKEDSIDAGFLNTEMTKTVDLNQKSDFSHTQTNVDTGSLLLFQGTEMDCIFNLVAKFEIISCVRWRSLDKVLILINEIEF